MKIAVTFIYLTKSNCHQQIKMQEDKAGELTLPKAQGNKMDKIDVGIAPNGLVTIREFHTKCSIPFLSPPTSHHKAGRPDKGFQWPPQTGRLM